MIKNKDIQKALDRLEGDNKDKVLIEHYIQTLERRCFGLESTVRNIREREDSLYRSYGWRD